MRWTSAARSRRCCVREPLRHPMDCFKKNFSPITRGYRPVSVRRHGQLQAMKHALIIIFAVSSFLAAFASSGKGADNANSTSKQMRITIGSSTFTATLSDNATATAFRGMLPMTIKMSELNGNEKYFDLPVNLPTNASNPGTIQSGDLMIYGSNTLVLFYKTFSTSYGYTRLGRINDTKGLASAVGSGSVTITYELE